MTYLIIHQKKTLREQYLQNTFLPNNFEVSQSQITNYKLIPDLHIIKPIFKQTIGIDEVKELFTQMIYRPVKLSKQIAIIYDAQTLTIEAQNAMLKNLEDGSPESVYILLVNNTKNLLKTVISRCTLHYVKDNTINHSSPPEKPNILTLTLPEQFDAVEEIVKTQKPTAKNKDTTADEEKESITSPVIDLLLQYDLYYKSMLEVAITKRDSNKTTTYQKALTIIQTTRQRLAGNANKRLALENMLLQLNNLK